MNCEYVCEKKKYDLNNVEDAQILLLNGESISVAKLKSIKEFDGQGRNADRALVEINSRQYGLPKRTGVDYQKFSRNRITKKP